MIQGHDIICFCNDWSGDPLSKHYDDLIEDWAWGQYHPMPFSRKAVEAVTEERMVLVPAGGKK